MDKVKLKYLTHCNVNKIYNITNETINYIDIGSVSSDNKVNEIQSIPLDESPSRARRRIKTGDTIISTVRTYLKAIAYVSEEMNNYVCSTGFAVFSANNNLTSKYLYYSTLSIKFIDEISKKSVGVSYPAINSSEIGNIKICKPTLKNQELVSNFLDFQLLDIDSLIFLKEKQIKLLEEQRQAMITEAVTKGLNPNVKMKDSGVDWIGEIPEHWEVKKIKHLSQVKRGASPRPIDDPKYYAVNGDYSWVRISDVTKSGKYLFNTRDKLSELGASKSVKRHRGDLFLSIAATVGKACITKIDCCIHDGFVYFDNLKVEEEYLFYIFEAGQCYRGLGKMGTQLNLNTDTVGNITIPVSSRNEIQEIIDYITNKDVEFLNLINAVKRSKEKLKEYRQSLIHEAVTGKIPMEEMETYLKEVEKNGG
ncbi:TPA: restriction endonuclease subunit S [Enterococcus faecalis]|nr:restriction endonuclease subunit S [Enterococcus faecalis]HAP3006634.1 restriction endonuclease subunit S [Enterococcus faecalis]